MKQIISLLITLSFSLILTAQESKSPTIEDDYKFLVMRGLEMLKTTNYDSCMTYFQEGFKIKQTSYLSTLRYAACAYSTGNEDLYQEQLDKAIELSWSGTKSIFENYEEFQYLYKTSFEIDLLDKYDEAALASGVNLSLMEEFKIMRIEDQKYRKQMRAVSDEHGWDSLQMDSLWALQNPIDSFNTARICQIMDDMGYPGKSIVGPAEASTAFLIIQHSEIETQEKYLDLITKAADNGEVKWRSVALLVDRVNLGQGKPQIYGSQVNTNKETGEYYFSEIAQPFKVDSLRGTVGLGPLQEYADHWDFQWDPVKHSKRVAEEKKSKDNSN